MQGHDHPVPYPAVVPRELFPKFARDMLDWHIATNGDFLVCGVRQGGVGVKEVARVEFMEGKGQVS